MTLYEEVQAALRQRDFKPKKRLGQNFLVHERVLDSIIRLLELGPQDKVLEIGPGLGFLTRRLLEKASEVYAVEVDAVLVDWLKESPLGAHPALRLIHGDILKVPLDKILPVSPIKLVGNLPYSISSPVLFRLFDWREHFQSLVLMVQREVADRIAAGPGSKAYGTLSVWCQIHGRIAERVPVAPEAFFPRPKVSSSILKVELYPQPLLPQGELPRLGGLVRSAFGHRRKTLANNLATWLKRNRRDIEDLLRREQIDPGRRGETLTIGEFIRLTRALKQSGLPAAATD